MIRRCVIDSRTFVTDEPGVWWCSPECRHVLEQRRNEDQEVAAQIRDQEESLTSPTAVSEAALARMALAEHPKRFGEAQDSEEAVATAVEVLAQEYFHGIAALHQLAATFSTPRDRLDTLDLASTFSRRLHDLLDADAGCPMVRPPDDVPGVGSISEEEAVGDGGEEEAV